MAKTFDKAVTGFNHNIKHNGKMFHVQTEDSGLNNPHIVTHLFLGGNIVASEKSSYSDLLGSENLSHRVRALMEAQHKAMLRSLVRGEHDASESVARHYDPGELALDEPSTEPTREHVMPIPAAESAPGFGEGLITERRLDEVIWSYLANRSE